MEEENENYNLSQLHQQQQQQEEKDDVQQMNNHHHQNHNHHHRHRILRHLSSSSTKWSSYTEEDEIFIQHLPKIELHVHLDGSFDSDTIWKYIQECYPDSSIFYCLPITKQVPWQKESLLIRSSITNCTTAKEYNQLCTCRGYRSLIAMLNCFEMFLPIIQHSTTTTTTPTTTTTISSSSSLSKLSFIEQLSYDFVIRQYTQNIVYTEVRYSPFLFIKDEDIYTLNHQNRNNDNSDTIITAEMIVEAVTRGLRRGCSKYNHNIIINQILCCITWKPQWAMDTLDLVTKYQYNYPCAIVGIDIAAGEEHYNTSQDYIHLYQPHYNMIQEAQRRNIPITLHAGEVPTSTTNTDNHSNNIERAILEYGARRIGHGYRMIDNIRTMDLVKKHNIHIEVCPTSSVETGGWIYDENKNNIDDDNDDNKNNKNDSEQQQHCRDWSTHPGVIMLRNNISIGINSDDPAVFHTSLSWQYRIALNKMKLSYHDIIQMNINAINAAFWYTQKDDDNNNNYIQQTQAKERIIQLLHCYGHVHGISIDIDDTSSNSSNSNSSNCTKCTDIVHNDWYRIKTNTFCDRVYLSYDDDDKT